MTDAVEYPDLVVVGAGLFGLTVAQQAVEHLGVRVEIIDVRDHIGGNAYSYMDEETGAEIHKYGAHLFHTSNKRVWDYVNRFTSFTDYVHRVYATHDGEVYPLPINLGTINQFFHAHYTPAEAKALVDEQAGELAGTDPKNLNDKGISLIGRPLYEAFIKNYTALVHDLGIDTVISPKDVTASQISSYVRGLANSQGSAVESLHKILGGAMEAVEFTATGATHFLNTPLKDLNFKPGLLVAAIVHGGKLLIPGGHSIISEGDRVIVVAKSLFLKDLNDILVR